MKLFLTILIVFINLTSFGQPETEEICAQQPTPEGWIIINHRLCNNCCGTETPQLGHMNTIRKIDNLPAGTTLEICSDQPLPKGWVIVSIRICRTDCCGSNGFHKLPTIKKLP